LQSLLLPAPTRVTLSCGDGAHAFVVAQAQSGVAGENASQQAQAGTLNESLAAAHAGLCDPK